MVRSSNLLLQLRMIFCDFASSEQQLWMSAIYIMVVSMVLILDSHETVNLIHAAPASPGHLLSIPCDGSTEREVLIANALSTSAPILRSNDGSYAWQFAPYQNNASRLLTVLNSAYNATMVWIANRNRPVSPDASLVVQLPSCAFLLREANGSVVWSSPVSGIGSVLLNTTGNLIMFNAENSMIWQSFDDASDVLVAGQILRSNHSMVSRVSLDNVSEGFYTVRMEPGGVVLYASFDWQQHMVPYVADTYSHGLVVSDELSHERIQAVRLSACNHTNLIYSTSGTGVALQQEGSIITPQCRAEEGNIADDAHSLQFGTNVAGEGLRYMRLMPNGDINTFLATTSGVVRDTQLFAGLLMNSCMLPSYCGINSLCSSPANCTCPDMFEPIDPSAANGQSGCRLIEPFNCSISDQHQFLRLPGLDYFANAYLDAVTVSSPDKCQNLCRANCSCTAAFYRNDSGTCHLYDQVQTMLPGPSPSITAFLRVAKLPMAETPGSGSISKKAIIGVTAGVAMLVVILALLVGWIGRKFMNRSNDESDSEEEAFLESLPGLPPRLTYKELQSATEGFSRKLGTGGSGAVYEGRILPVSQHRKNKQPATNMVEQENVLLTVAVKELQMSRFPTIAASGKKQFRAEVATLGSLSHVNLVQLRGFCAEGAHRLLVYEFLENGSLDRWIFNSAVPLQWEVRYRIAIDTARGLAFLHEGSRNKVVHLDVKPQNILLDSNFRAKLADFGLCKLVEREAERVAAEGAGVAESQTVTAMRGTPGYMAPEWFLNLPVTDRSDVFSYGMVLLELVGGRKNLNLAASNMEEWYIPAWAVRQAESGNLLDIIDKQLTQLDTDQSASAMCAAMTRLLHVAFWCIQENSASRPSMGTILLMLEEHLQVPNPPLDQAYVVGRRSQPSQASSSTSAKVSSLASAVISELEPR